VDRRPEPINIISEAKYNARKDFQIWRIGVPSGSLQ
jgi:hypothetical protein